MIENIALQRALSYLITTISIPEYIFILQTKDKYMLNRSRVIAGFMKTIVCTPLENER